jgi:hypothetical protein
MKLTTSHQTGQLIMEEIPVELSRLIFEINFYESKIAYHQEMISQCKKELDKVKDELRSHEVNQEC